MRAGSRVLLPVSLLMVSTVMLVYCRLSCLRLLALGRVNQGVANGLQYKAQSYQFHRLQVSGIY